MKFHRLKDVSLSPTDFVCRDATWPKAVMTLLGVLVFGGALGAVFIYHAWEKIPGPVRYFVAPVWGVVMLLWVWVCGTDWLKSLGPQNWLLRINSQGVWIKFRSFANAHFGDEDEVVIQLDQRDIAWAGALRECVIRPGPGEGRSQQWEWTRHLLIGLGGTVDAGEIERRFVQERNRRPPVGRVTTVVYDYPVRFVENSVLRIEWKSSKRRATPSLTQALGRLSSFAEIRESPEKVIDLAKPAADQRAMESQIIELLERGDQIGAIKLARKCYRCSLSDAKDFVEQLSCGNRTAVPSKG